MAFSLDGTERIKYVEIDQVLDTLISIGSALALFHIKDVTSHDALLKSMHEFTDGMTKEQVEEYTNDITDLIKILQYGSEGSFHTEGSLKIVDGRFLGGALMTLNGVDIGFPFGGTTQKMPGGYKQQRIAEKVGENLHLRCFIDGAPEVASLSTWHVALPSGQIGFSLKEARYWQVKDYGRVLLNQEIEAVGVVCKA